MRRFPFVALAAVLAACSGSEKRGRPTADTTVTAPPDSGWRDLSDGTMSAWRGYRRQDVPEGWKVSGDTISKKIATGDIVTRDRFGDFVLELEWKIGPGGNAGIFYRGTEEYERIYWTAPEYQLLDDAGAPNGESRLTSAGADYGLYPSPPGIVKPANEWNATRIAVHGNHVEHWLNGQKLLEYELGGDDWKVKVAASKFAAWPNYGKAAGGHIAIQGDHEGNLSLRNIRIRPLQ